VDAGYEWFIERVPVTKWTMRDLDRYKEMVNEGWQLQVLLAVDRSHIVALGLRWP
jgi:hypothetical protein